MHFPFAACFLKVPSVPLSSPPPASHHRSLLPKCTLPNPERIQAVLGVQHRDRANVCELGFGHLVQIQLSHLGDRRLMTSPLSFSIYTIVIPTVCKSCGCSNKLQQTEWPKAAEIHSLTAVTKLPGGFWGIPPAPFSFQCSKVAFGWCPRPSSLCLCPRPPPSCVCLSQSSLCLPLVYL